MMDTNVPADLFDIQYIRKMFAKSPNAWEAATTACMRFNRYHTPLIQWIQAHAPEFHSLVFTENNTFSVNKFTTEEHLQLVYGHARNAKHPKDNPFKEGEPDHECWKQFFLKTHKRRLVKVKRVER